MAYHRQRITVLFFIPIIIAIAGIYGWVCNIITLAESDFAVITGMTVVRILGVIIPPVGAIVGYL